MITGQRSSADLRLLPAARKKRARPPGSSQATAISFRMPGPRDRSCQTYRMTDGPEGDIVAAMSAELTACRNRGIERLELRTHNQAPVPTPQLQRLASEYLTATERRASDRIGQIKYLLRDAITAFADEDEDQAELVKDLFFGDSQNRVTKSAGEQLDTARRKSGSNEARFRQARHDAFDSFANFIPRFIACAQPETVAEEATETVPESAPYNNSALASEVQRQVATIGYIDDSEHFISLLSQARRVRHENPSLPAVCAGKRLTDRPQGGGWWSGTGSNCRPSAFQAFYHPESIRLEKLK